jgi:putative SOS response-associated peptidase YedK
LTLRPAEAVDHLGRPVTCSPRVGPANDVMNNVRDFVSLRAAIITEPNAMVAEVHDRMPVVLVPERFTSWIENEAGLEILLPATEGVLQRWSVSKRVNGSKAPKDDATLAQPVDVDAPQLQV